MMREDKLSNISNNVTRRNSWPHESLPRRVALPQDSSFEDICGKNIAIDTDDLVLANENMSLVIGTYGNRGKEAPPTGKNTGPSRDRYHDSWPEYLVLVEILLAKKSHAQLRAE